MNYIVLLAFLGVAVWSDITTTKISNRMILAGLAAGASFRIWGSGGAGIFTFLVNISIPVILLYLLFLKRALGAGDIKLFSVAGGFLERRELINLIIIAFVVAAVLSVLKLVQLAAQKKLNRGERHYIHFSAAILIGYLMCLGVGI